MCTISDRLKLCTCKTENVEQLKHYWILKRPKDTEIIVGLLILPADIGKEADQINQQNILRQLNNDNCFDVELQEQENDTLELHFTFKTDPNKSPNFSSCYDDYLTYEFTFENGKWKERDFNPHEMGFEKIQKGKIVRPFSKSKRQETVK